MTRRSTSICRSARFRGTLGRVASLLAFSAVPIVGACSTADDAVLDDIGLARQGVIGVDCDLAVTAVLQTSSNSNFSARVTVTNNAGSTASDFRILVRAGAAQLFQMDEGTFQVVEGGYLLSPGTSQLKSGKAYSFVLTFSGAYTGIAANVLSNAGVQCDNTPPAVTLTTSAKFLSRAGSLTLKANPTDNVEVAKVVFSQDGVVMGEDRTAPFAWDIAASSALNGGHNYVATAYDLSGNVASSTPKRVRISVDEKFFGNILAYDGDTTNFRNYFNQVTPGNAGKWGTVETNARQHELW